MRFANVVSALGLALALAMGIAGVSAHAQGKKDSASGVNDAQIQLDLKEKLGSKRFSGVKPEVKRGVVTLSGTVELYSAKADADNRAHHIKNVLSVRNMIDVASATELTDVQLRDKLAEKLSYDRVGYGTNAFNSFTIGVQDGVVTLGGVAYGPMDRDSAVSLVANFPGVKDVVDNIEVAPLSPNDDRIRLAVARSVYGFPSLNKYAIDPAKPIRIVVVNGNVTLAGVVDNQADKDAAGIRANGVSGVFKVTNDLQVAGAVTSER
ncbi:BON domain-containing protein [Terriglobus tenax]|uniref:BON domain-containing protein n=1 Tax=Terriglobus tenax TaxID=1111115 RepID=UPI0021DFF2CE|nr:BON domain-containing protein [Terriglobus tenax]